MQTIAETPIFTRQADKLFSDDQKRVVTGLAAALKAIWKDKA